MTAKKKKATFTADERAAMKAYAKEKQGGKNRTGEADVLAAIAAMPEPDRSLATRVHALVTAAAPAFAPRTWYGMPAYARDDKVVCFFQAASKFKTRYATLGFADKAALDDGAMWPVAFAVAKLGAAEERRITELVARAAR
jgi:hypothetical protein